MLDRKKDMINRGGFHVDRATVADTLAGHPEAGARAFVDSPCALPGPATAPTEAA